MDFFNKTGKMAIGSRRMLTEMITENAAHICKLYNIDMQPKWFPVFYILSQSDAKMTTDVAKEIGHSNPFVSKIIREMAKDSLVTEKKDESDGRRNMVSLSTKGMSITAKIEDQYADVNQAIEQLIAQTGNDLWKAIEKWEFLLEQKSLFNHVRDQAKERESTKVSIVDYTSDYKQVFRDLNGEWISKWFKMEEADYKALNNPESYIFNKGGHILVALYNNKPAGVCALIKMNDNDYEYEMAKMTVSPTVQGKNIGFLLGRAIIKKAKSLGAKNIYMESNTILKPAINLYHKLGFNKVAARASPYKRSNIQMELIIK